MTMKGLNFKIAHKTEFRHYGNLKIPVRNLVKITNPSCSQSEKNTLKMLSMWGAQAVPVNQNLLEAKRFLYYGSPAV